MPDRTSTHGPFDVGSAFTQQVKDMMRRMPSWELMLPHQREALDMCAHKMQRILAGDPAHEDHWQDLGDYALIALRWTREVGKRRKMIVRRRRR